MYETEANTVGASINTRWCFLHCTLLWITLEPSVVRDGNIVLGFEFKLSYLLRSLRLSLFPDWEYLAYPPLQANTEIVPRKRPSISIRTVETGSSALFIKTLIQLGGRDSTTPQNVCILISSFLFLLLLHLIVFILLVIHDLLCLNYILLRFPLHLLLN
jgi:hypothetical protein